MPNKQSTTPVKGTSRSLRRKTKSAGSKQIGRETDVSQKNRGGGPNASIRLKRAVGAELFYYIDFTTSQISTFYENAQYAIKIPCSYNIASGRPTYPSICLISATPSANGFSSESSTSFNRSLEESWASEIKTSLTSFVVLAQIPSPLEVVSRFSSTPQTILILERSLW